MSETSSRPSRGEGGFAVVSGGSSGIGLACAAELAGRGCRVALLARDPERLRRARAAIMAARPAARVTIRSVDVSNAEACAETVRRLVEAEGAPDWVVASAGIARPGLFLEQDLAEHERHMRTNYLGAVNLVHSCAPSMARRGSGRIVLVSSAAALAGIYGYAAYGSSKFALRGLGEVLRVELAGCGISVTVAHPSDTDTPQLRDEMQLRPLVTQIVSKGGGLWQPDAVARAIIAAADRRRFYVGPGMGAAVLAYLGWIAGQILRRRQIRIARGVDREARPDGSRRNPQREPH
jgi:3-dehydrosphinganine reductase